MLARGGMQCDSRLKIVLEIEISKTSKKKGPRCPYKKKLNNSFLTHLHYYIIISKLLNIINATIYYYYFINWHKSVEYCLEKWETVEVEGENQLKKVGNMKSGENLSISGEQKIIPLCLIRSVV
jgi:hypothetical protein